MKNKKTLKIYSKCLTRGNHLTKKNPNDSQIVIFTKINHLALFPFHLNPGFLSNFDFRAYCQSLFADTGLLGCKKLEITTLFNAN